MAKNEKFQEMMTEVQKRAEEILRSGEYDNYSLRDLIRLSEENKSRESLKSGADLVEIGARNIALSKKINGKGDFSISSPYSMVEEKLNAYGFEKVYKGQYEAFGNSIEEIFVNKEKNIIVQATDSVFKDEQTINTIDYFSLDGNRIEAEDMREGGLSLLRKEMQRTKKPYKGKLGKDHTPLWLLNYEDEIVALSYEISGYKGNYTEWVGRDEDAIFMTVAEIIKIKAYECGKDFMQMTNIQVSPKQYKTLKNKYEVLKISFYLDNNAQVYSREYTPKQLQERREVGLKYIGKILKANKIEMDEKALKNFSNSQIRNSFLVYAFANNLIKHKNPIKDLSERQKNKANDGNDHSM